MGVVSHPLRFLRPRHDKGPDAPKVAPPVAGDDLLKALVLRQHQKAELGRILIAEGLAGEDQVLAALSQQYAMPRVDLEGQIGSTRLLVAKPARFWLRHDAIPWIQLGQTVTIAIAHPDRFEQLRQELRGCFDDITPVLAKESQITALLTRHFSPAMVQQASCSVSQRLSCRNLDLARGKALLIACILPTITLVALAPVATFTGLCGVALSSVFLFTLLKLCGLASSCTERGRPAVTSHSATAPPPRPVISVMVPLFREAAISRALLHRLRKLTYPRALTDIILVLEAHDDITRRALSHIQLPPWIRVVEVPAFGGLTTKPRAMNYALNFCRGEIVGVWDAEDAPQKDQLETVAGAFSTAPPKTACFQGVLDYYNPDTNWIARCFTLEYGSWFRIVLRGIARFGLVVPLGGTTMFIRRKVLEELGGWDAHNVTEDADLGVRLYRAGYRTQMLPTTTYEEANCRPWPWVKQRSRWLKGFMVTYLVHMRQPLRLLAELGVKRFLGFQAFFIGTIGQFIFAPILWSFWLITLGLPHPSSSSVPAGLLMLAAATLVFFELLGLVLGIAAAFAMRRPHLALWAPSLILYFPMGVIAVANAAYELLVCPFFWDKTAHGIEAPDKTTERPRRWGRLSRARSHPASIES